MNTIFDLHYLDEFENRLQHLDSKTQPQWGRMSVSQMLAHCNVVYGMVYSDSHPKPNALKLFFLKMVVKNIVVGDRPYAKNGRTTPEFIFLINLVLIPKKSG